MPERGEGEGGQMSPLHERNPFAMVYVLAVATDKLGHIFLEPAADVGETLLPGGVGGGGGGGGVGFIHGRSRRLWTVL